MIEGYPLYWPEGWPRTDPHAREWSRFQVSLWDATQGIVRELELLGASNVIISSNLRLRRDGLPYADQREPDEPGVAVYFDYNGSQQCIPCDKWLKVKENMRAIELTIGALRGLDRWGAKEMVDAAFRGFKALPAAGETTPSAQRLWYDVLQVSAQADWEVVEAAYKRLLHKVHPDKGGSTAAFAEVQAAFEQAKEIYGK